MSRWEIWDAWVAYEDKPSIREVRPVLIYENNAYIIIGYKITHTDRGDRKAEMKIENPKEAGLDEDRSSYIRLRKVIKLKEYDLVRYRGKLSDIDILKFETRIIEISKE